MRTDAINWYDFFMYTALLSAQRSKDPSTQVGACIVDQDNKIVGIGYNGLPQGCSDSDFPWGKESSNPIETKYPFVVHAEKNAILNSDRTNLKECKIFVTLFPCNECAKDIIQSGISAVYYYQNKNPENYQTIASKMMFEAAGIPVTQYTPVKNRLCLKFD